MKNVFVFGASNGGLNYITNQVKYNVLGLIDNDVQKHGQSYGGIKVYSPEYIKEANYDFIIIASMYIEAITKQLKNELQVDEKKILYSPKKMMKTQSKPFSDDETLELAKKVLVETLNYLEENDYKCFINFGTLLGVAREGDLIPWDDDIDIAIIDNFSNDHLFINRIRTLYKDLMGSHGFKVTSFLKYNKLEELLGIDLEISNVKELPFVLSLDLLKIEGENAYLPIDILPSNFFCRQDEIELNGNTLKTPSPYKEYLTHVYGDWNTVKKDVTFEDNTTTYNEPDWMEIVSETIE